MSAGRLSVWLVVAQPRWGQGSIGGGLRGADRGLCYGYSVPNGTGIDPMEATWCIESNSGSNTDDISADTLPPLLQYLDTLDTYCSACSIILCRVDLGLLCRLIASCRLQTPQTPLTCLSRPIAFRKATVDPFAAKITCEELPVGNADAQIQNQYE